jgi:hypothetical protein
MTEQPEGRTSTEGETSTEEMEKVRRAQVIYDNPKWAYRFGFIPVRRLTARERIEQLLLAEAEREYLQGGDIKSLETLRNTLAAAQPATPQDRPKDPLDRVRVVATLIMVVALFAIVVVVVRETKPSESVTSLVSLASGLAGIGLGWLFGAATMAGKTMNPP